MHSKFSSFEDMGILFFADLASNAYSRPQNFDFWGKIWENLPVGENDPIEN